MKLIELLGSNPILKKTYLDVLPKQRARCGFVKLDISLRLIYFLAICLALFYFFISHDLAECEETDSRSMEVLTLEEALSMALSLNRRIYNAELQVEKADDKISAARTKLFPEFDFSLYEAHHFTEEAFTFQKGAFGDFRFIGPVPARQTKIATAPKYTTFLDFSITQPISQLYQILLVIKQKKVERDIFDEDLRSKQQEIADKVKKLYYDILKTESSLKATEEKIVFLAELDVLVDRYVQVQRALKSESLDVKARLGKVEYDAFRDGNTLATQKEKLNELLARDIETPFKVNPVPDAYPYMVNFDEAQEIALTQRPEVRAAVLNLLYAENEVTIKKSEYIPEISLAFQYSANFNIKLLPENIVTLGILLKWDIFDWGYRQKEIAEKRKSVLQAKNLLSESESQVRIDVNKSIRSLEETEVLIGVTRKDQAAKREKLREVMNKYKVDSALLQEVLEVEAALGEANNKYQQAVLDYWTSRANLEKALGEI